MSKWIAECQLWPGEPSLGQCPKEGSLATLRILSGNNKVITGTGIIVNAEMTYDKDAQDWMTRLRVVGDNPLAPPQNLKDVNNCLHKNHVHTITINAGVFDLWQCSFRSGSEFDDDDDDEESSSGESSVSTLSTSVSTLSTSTHDPFTPSSPSGTSAARKLTRYEIVTAAAEFAKAATPEELEVLRNQILAIGGDLELPDPKDDRRIVDF